MVMWDLGRDVKHFVCARGGASLASYDATKKSALVNFYQYYNVTAIYIYINIYHTE